MGFVTKDGSNGRRVPVLEDLGDPSGARVLLRATFDRPLADDPALPLAQRRAKGLAATIDWLHVKGARITVCGDTGLAEGAAADQQLDRLRRAVEQASTTLADAGDAVTFRCSAEDTDVVRRLVDGHDLFVNDTLQDSILPVPSLTLPPTRLPAAVGRTLQHDLSILDTFLLDPARPFVVLLGGERSFDRLHGLEGLMLRADTVLLGGGLALPMLQALGSQPAGNPTDAFLWECRSIFGLSQRVHHHVVVPLDLVWRRADGSLEVTPADQQAGEKVVDIGPVTRVRFSEVLAGARSILWAGALGMVEDDSSTGGTKALAEHIPSGASVVLGGDALVTALEAAHRLPPSAEMLSATDAAVELLKNGDLPALAAIRRTEPAAEHRPGSDIPAA
jgi:phosphoglycerate kinase